MLSAGQRMVVLISMWVAVGIGMFSIGIYGAETGTNVEPLFVLMLLASMFATIVLSGALPGLPFSSREHGKAKRDLDRKHALLLELMDDDERMAFKEALKQRVLGSNGDGELPFSADLLEALEHQDTASRRTY